MQIMNPANLATASMADLVETYNFLYAGPKPPVKKFENRLVGVRRVAELLATARKSGASASSPAEAAMKAIAKAATAHPIPTGDAERRPRKAPAKKAAGAKATTAKFPPTARIIVLAAKNPKRAGTLAFEEFEFYKKAKTVQAYVDMGGQLAYMNYDVKRGFIKIEVVK